MVVRRKDGSIEDDVFFHIADRLPADSVLVWNNTRVRKARIKALAQTGGRVEFLLLRQKGPCIWEAITSKGKRQKIGRNYNFPGGLQGEIIGQFENMKTIRFSKEITEDYLGEHGEIPLPPYVKRNAEENDEHTYQTVYAKETGSVAAPTAGLHFTDSIIEKMKKRGITVVTVTLHVGIGTFTPIRTEDIRDHKMHEEHYSIDESTADTINRAKSENRPVIAVGTTTVRTLESAGRNGTVKPGSGSTDLYILPGYTFSVVDGLITNFHTPESSLFVMVSAFAGLKLMQKAYRYGVKQKYRFFSYGDSMYLPP